MFILIAVVCSYFVSLSSPLYTFISSPCTPYHHFLLSCCITSVPPPLSSPHHNHPHPHLCHPPQSSRVSCACRERGSRSGGASGWPEDPLGVYEAAGKQQTGLCLCLIVPPYGYLSAHVCTPLSLMGTSMLMSVPLCP